MSVPFELLCEKIKELDVRIRYSYNFRRLTLEDYFGEGLMVMHRPRVRRVSTKTGRQIWHRPAIVEVMDETQLTDVLREYEPIEVVKKVGEYHPTIDLDSHKGQKGYYYEIVFEDNLGKRFRMFYYFGKEAKVERILDSIEGKEGVYSTRYHIELTATQFSRNYDEMLGILRCIDELYTIVTAMGYHTPPSSRKDGGTGVQRRFELFKIRNRSMIRHRPYFFNEDLKHLAFDLLLCTREYGGFTLEDCMLFQPPPGQVASTKVIGDRRWIGKVHDKELYEAHKGDRRFATSGENLYARIVPLYK